MNEDTKPEAKPRRPWGSAVACFALLFFAGMALTIANLGVWSDYTVSVKWFALRMPTWLAWYSYGVARCIPLAFILAVALPVAVLAVPAFQKRRARATCIAACAALHVLFFLGHWTIMHRMTGCTFVLALFFWGAAPFHAIHYLLRLIRSA